MSEEEIHAYVVKRLANHANRDELVYQLCNEHGLSWPDAEALVNEVELEHEAEIETRQLPLNAFLAAGLMLAGLALVIYGTYLVSIFWGLTASEAAGISGFFPRGIEEQVELGIRQYNLSNNLILLANTAPFSLELIFTGAALMLGSVFGMKQVWQTIFEHFRI